MIKHNEIFKRGLRILLNCLRKQKFPLLYCVLQHIFGEFYNVMLPKMVGFSVLMLPMVFMFQSLTCQFIAL